MDRQTDKQTDTSHQSSESVKYCAVVKNENKKSECQDVNILRLALILRFIPILV
jgi:hypothetical protein